MNILVIGRTLPTTEKGSYGLFEFQQASALSKKCNVGYLFIDNSSIKLNRKIKKVNQKMNDIPSIGYSLPIGGVYYKVYDRIKAFLFIQAYNQFLSKYWKPDVIHIHFPLIVLNETILNFLKSQNLKIVVTEHWSKVQKQELSAEKVKLLNKIYDCSSAFICVSDTLKQSVKELLKGKNVKITVVPNMVSNFFFQESSQSHKTKKEIEFTYIGGLTRNKNVDMLISAFQLEFKKENDVILNIIGDGPERAKLEELINNKFKERILFHGNMSQKKVSEKLQETSVFASASSYETFGVPFIEAMATGTPVIGPDNLPIRKYINRSTGVLFKANDKVALTEKIRYMYKNLSKFDSNTIKSDIYEDFSEESIASKLKEIYKLI